MPGPSLGGLVVVDKPSGWTSHDVVARLRRAYGTRRVGHAGTLDPMATGVLVVGVEWSTKLLTEITGVDKTYAATIRLGVSTTTDDAEGEIVETADARGIDRDTVLAGIRSLTGAISQRPSSVSAIKIDGRRAYARVRAGEDVVLPERPVTVHAFTLDGLGEPVSIPDGAGSVLDLDVTVRCSSGTYIRALARDLGAGLGVGGHLTALRRLAVGPWTLADAVTLDELLSAPRLTDPADAACRLLPRIDLDEAGAASFRHGRRVAVSGSPHPDPDPDPAADPADAPSWLPTVSSAGSGSGVLSRPVTGTCWSR
jgi:tRNA pseudouridine55 synthase